MKSKLEEGCVLLEISSKNSKWNKVYPFTPNIAQHDILQNSTPVNGNKSPNLNQNHNPNTKTDYVSFSCSNQNYNPNYNPQYSHVPDQKGKSYHWKKQHGTFLGVITICFFWLGQYLIDF